MYYNKNAIITFIYSTSILVLLVLFKLSVISDGIGNKIDPGLAKRIKQHVKKLSHDIGDRNIGRYKNLNKAAAYISNEFKSYGLPVLEQVYDAEGYSVKNIISTIKGTEKPGDNIIIGAHYDSCSNPGADDNASAVAGMLEIARHFSGKKTVKTLRFAAFVNEEPPFFKTKLMGSYVYASSLKKSGIKVNAAIILEMIGYYSNNPGSQKYPPIIGFFYPDTGNFIAVVSDFSNRGLAKSVYTSFKKSSRFPVEKIALTGIVPGVDFSDHWSFWQMDYPAVMITDTAFYRNNNYHKPTDTYDTLDYASAAGVITGLRGVISDLAEK